MWEQIFDLALNNGLWAVLFLALLVYQLKDSRAREKKYQQTISELNVVLLKVNEIDSNVYKLSENLAEVGSNIKRIENSVCVLTKEKKRGKKV